MSDPVRHAPNCDAPDVHRRPGRLGDTLDFCRSCGRFAVVPPALPKPPPARFVCRPHGYPVDHKGKGCGACARDHRKAKERA